MSPKPSSYLEQRLRRQIVKVCRALSARALVAATDGNVSARLSPDRILVTPSNVAKGEVTPESVLVCDAAGRKVRGSGTVTSEVRVHLAAYRVRPECQAVVHAHPPLVSAFLFAGRATLLREPVIPEAVAHLGALPLAPYHRPGTTALALAVEQAFRAAPLILMDQHGPVACGVSPWEAYMLLEKLEHTALVLKAALELAGGPGGLRRLSAAQIAELMPGYQPT